MNPAVAALRRLIGNTAESRLEVAETIGFNEQTLYQIARGIKLQSGQTRGVGRKLREALDQHYPNWMELAADPAAVPRIRSALPTLAQSLEVLGIEMAKPMPDDVRDDIAHALSNLAKRRGLKRDQNQVLALLLQTGLEKQRVAACQIYTMPHRRLAPIPKAVEHPHQGAPDQGDGP